MTVSASSSTSTPAGNEVGGRTSLNALDGDLDVLGMEVAGAFTRMANSSGSGRCRGRLADHDDGNNVDLLAGLDGLEVACRMSRRTGEPGVLDEASWDLPSIFSSTSAFLLPRTIGRRDRERRGDGLFAVAVEDRPGTLPARRAAKAPLPNSERSSASRTGVVAHVFSFISQVRRRCRQSEGSAARINSSPVDNGGYGSASRKQPKQGTSRRGRM